MKLLLFGRDLPADCRRSDRGKRAAAVLAFSTLLLALLAAPDQCTVTCGPSALTSAGAWRSVTATIPSRLTILTALAASWVSWRSIGIRIFLNMRWYLKDSV